MHNLLEPSLLNLAKTEMPFFARVQRTDRNCLTQEDIARWREMHFSEMRRRFDIEPRATTNDATRKVGPSNFQRPYN
jgi:hypothetical protein